MNQNHIQFVAVVSEKMLYKIHSCKN